MGIVNVTPDSFSDGGQHFDAQAAIRHAYRLLEDGAHILDLGAESTRPGAEPVPAAVEWARLEPVVKELCRNAVQQISVDTYRAETAKRALDYGVHMINDIWGGLADAAMLPLVADAGCKYVWMHNRSTPPDGDGITCLLDETTVGLRRCLEAGIAEQQIWLDPGIGFGKTNQQNLAVLKQLHKFVSFNYPVLLGASRKRFIGQALALPVHERLEGSLAAVALGVWQGVHSVRVHDVQASLRICRMVEAIQYA